MRYSTALLIAFALVTLPLTSSVNAQESSSDQPALELKLDESGVAAAPAQPRLTEDGFSAAEATRRVRASGAGLGVSLVALVGGAAMMGVAGANSICFPVECEVPSSTGPLLAVGSVLFAGGLAGLIGSSIALSRRNSDRRTLRSKHHFPSRREFALAGNNETRRRETRR
jgi:hypothetical protein